MRLDLTQRAADDLVAIVEYSAERWGARVAERYLDDLEAGIRRIQQQPDLLRSDPDLHPSLQFYRVNKHLLVCDAQPPSIVLLTIPSVSMDLQAHLKELQPILAREVEILHQRLRAH